MKKYGYMVYYLLATVALICSVTGIYSFQTLAFVLSGLLMLVKVLTSIALPSQLSNSYSQELLSSDLNNNPVMSYRTLGLLLLPLLVIIVVTSLVG